MIFINMNRIFAFLLGYVAMCCVGIYCMVESFKKVK